MSQSGILSLETTLLTLIPIAIQNCSNSHCLSTNPTTYTLNSILGSLTKELFSLLGGCLLSFITNVTSVNYRTISNLAFMSKLLEKVVASQLTVCLSSRTLSDPNPLPKLQCHSDLLMSCMLHCGPGLIR